mgnify:FL=1
MHDYSYYEILENESTMKNSVNQLQLEYQNLSLLQNSLRTGEIGEKNSDNIKSYEELEKIFSKSVFRISDPNDSSQQI